jgi:hypothetical protein
VLIPGGTEPDEPDRSRAGAPSADLGLDLGHLVGDLLLVLDLRSHGGAQAACQGLELVDERLDVRLSDHVGRGGGRGSRRCLGGLELVSERAGLVLVLLLGQLVLGHLLGVLGVVALLAGRDELLRGAVVLDVHVVRPGEEDPRHRGLLARSRRRSGHDDVESLLQVVRGGGATTGARTERLGRLARGVLGVVAGGEGVDGVGVAHELVHLAHDRLLLAGLQVGEQGGELIGELVDVVGDLLVTLVGVEHGSAPLFRESHGCG